MKKKYENIIFAGTSRTRFFLHLHRRRAMSRAIEKALQDEIQGRFDRMDWHAYCLYGRTGGPKNYKTIEITDELYEKCGADKKEWELVLGGVMRSRYNGNGRKARPYNVCESSGEGKDHLTLVKPGYK